MKEILHIVMLQTRHFVWRGIGILGSMAMVLTMAMPCAQAFIIETGNPDLMIHWDNTVKYSAAMRLEKQADELVGDINQDDGDRAFSRGLVSNRLDLFTEFDVSYKGWGARVSAAAWYDTIYNESNDNDSPGTTNAFSKPFDEFTDDTRDLHGRDAEILDAFLFGKKYIGNTTLSIRGGQYAMQWGESLFFGNNGIAGGMAPSDAVKALSVPNSQFKEIIRPVPQVSGQLQIGYNFSIGAYYQFGWEETRLPGVGSYFGDMDYYSTGGERFFTGGPMVPGGENAAFYRGDDIEADDNGQGGIQIRFRVGEYDFGAYAIRYHDKTPQLYLRPSVAQTPGGAVVLDPANFDPLAGKIGEYYWVYPENIQAYGLSSTTTFGNVNLAAEVSMRIDTPLVSGAGTVLPDMSADNDDNPLYAVGDSFHAQLSWIATMEPSFIAREADFIGEIAYNRRTRISENSSALDPNTDKDALGIRVQYEPKYRQLLPGLDITVPIGMSYFPMGASSVVGGFGVDDGGEITVGLTGTYLDAWRLRLAYTHYYGPSGPKIGPDNAQSFQQTFADRDFIAFSVSRTF